MFSLPSSVTARPNRLREWLPVLLTACAPPVFAQVPVDIPLEQLMGMQMVKAASKSEQLVGEAPAAASVLTSADIHAHGWRTLGQALATLPGLYITDDRNYTYLGARGFLRPGDYNSRFLLMIDGVRTNDSLYDQAMLGNESLVDMDVVQRIESSPAPAPPCTARARCSASSTWSRVTAMRWPGRAWRQARAVTVNAARAPATAGTARAAATSWWRRTYSHGTAKTCIFPNSTQPAARAARYADETANRRASSCSRPATEGGASRPITSIVPSSCPPAPTTRCRTRPTGPWTRTASHSSPMRAASRPA